MRIIKYLVIILIICISINVKAINLHQCQNEELKQLTELANQVQFKPNYTLSEKSVEGEGVINVEAIYNLELLNDNSKLKYYYVDNNTKEEVTASSLNEINFYGGQTISIQIYSKTLTVCTNKILKTEVIKLPKYNMFYYDNKEQCQKYQEFKYCKEFIDTGISYSEMEDLFDEYIKANTTTEENNFIKDNKYYIIGILSMVLIIIGVSIIVINNKNKKEKI